MPDLTVSLTAAQVTRVRAAFGVGTTQADIETWIKDQLKNRVRDIEASADANTKYDAVSSENW